MTGDGPGRPPGVWPVDLRGALLLVAAAVVVWLILPTAPNYDTATHLVWARELLDGRSPDVSAAASPTLHPLWLLVAVPASATGYGAALLQLVALISFAVVIASAYRLASDIAGWIAGAAAALATASSFALMLLAFKAYVDLPFLALVLTALVVEWRAGRLGRSARVDATTPPGAERADQGVRALQSSRSAPVGPLVVPGLMFVAGLLRPEAWAFGLLFVALRVVRDGVPRGGLLTAARVQLLPALVVVAAPVLWILTDLLLTGDPFHSLNGTQALAEELGRPTGLLTAPKELAVLLSDLARPPVAAAGFAGLILAVWLRGWRPLLLPLAVLGAAGAGFLLVGALGLPLLQRYLLVPAVLVCVFAGVAGAVVLAWARGVRDPGGALAAWAGKTPTQGASPAQADAAGAPEARSAAAGVPAALRAGAIAALVVGVLGVGGYLVLKADSFRIVAQGVLREARWQREAAELVKSPAVVAAARCGPITLPTYRFIPELTLRAELPAGEVVSRATALGGTGPQTTGVALVIEGNHAAKIRLGWAAGVPRTTNEIPAGFTPIGRRGPFLATARCG